ncbi:MAG: XdhC family protein, partial [Acidimicrobiia bacterium]
MPVYEALRDALREERSVVLATVTVVTDADDAADTPKIGAKLLAAPDGTIVGSLGDAELDRVVTRDALGELQSGLTSTRHYGAHGEAREDTITVFIE